MAKNESVKPTLLFKYGGNAMTDPELKLGILTNICALKEEGFNVIIVHGGGPFIKLILQQAGIESEFIDGQRKTTREAMEYVEMALKGKVNGNLVSLINSLGCKAAGLSGKDGQTVFAKKRLHKRVVNGDTEIVDLGQVGDVDKVDPRFINLLLENDFIPVITCVASDKNGDDYNINGDMFAGHIAGAVSAQQYVVLTDVDGLMLDKDKPESMITGVTISELEVLKKQGVIQGGMIPKIESCEIALKNGAESARIINGTEPGQIKDLFANRVVGTTIKK